MTGAEFDAQVSADVRELMRAGEVEELRIQAAEAFEAKLEAERNADAAQIVAHDAEREWKRAQDRYEAAAKARRQGDAR